jgi:predicted negative regulator of RcsB-dependent stress response
MALNYYHKAEQDYKALTMHPEASFLSFNSLGDCYKAQGKPDKAISSYIKAL